MTIVQDRCAHWFIVTGESTLETVRAKLAEMLDKAQIAVRSQRVYNGSVAPSTIDHMVTLLAMIADWNRDFPLRRIPRQEALW